MFYKFHSIVFYRVLLLFKVTISCLLPPVLVILQRFASLSPFILLFFFTDVNITHVWEGRSAAGGKGKPVSA